MTALKKLYSAIVRFEEICSKMLLIVIVLITFGSAVTRYFNISFIWSLDLVLLLFAWFSFLASSQAIRRRSIISVTLVVDRLPKKVRQVIAVFNDVLMIGFMVVIIVYSVQIAIINWRQRIVSLAISYSWILLALSAGGTMMTLGLIIQLVEHVKVLLGKKEETEFEVYSRKNGGDGT